MTIRKSARPTVVVVSSFPPPVTGLTVQVSGTVDYLRRSGWEVRKVKLLGRGGGDQNVSFKRVLIAARAALELSWHLSVLDNVIVYHVLGQSKKALVRDCVAGCLAWAFGHRIVFALYGGRYHKLYRSVPAPIQWIMRQILALADNITVESESLMRCFGFDKGIAEKVVVVPNAVYVDVSSRNAPKELPVTEREGDIEVGYLSNLIPQKGYRELIVAGGVLRREYGVKVRLRFAGEFKGGSRGVDRQIDEFWRIVEEQGIEDEVDVHGVVTGREKIKFLETVHFLVLPTRYENEGFPVSLLEGMAFGCVVIATRFRGIPDMVTDGWNGALVRCRSPREIARKLDEIIQDGEKYRFMSRNAMESYERKYTPEHKGERLERILFRE